MIKTRDLIKLVIKIFPGSSVLKSKNITPSEAGRILSQHKKVIRKNKNSVDKDQLNLL